MNTKNGIIIAGSHSGCGKTTITFGVLAALRKKGLCVQAFKVGPDFIDPGLHEIITDRPSRNLDIWMCGKDYVVECFSKNTEDVDIAVVEGVMGLFDGGVASTAEVAKTLGLPVVLIVDAHSMAESAAALVKGFKTFDQGINIAGVIFNKVAGERHIGMLSDAIKKYTNVKMLGYLPKQIEFSISERHLGLLTKEESPISKEILTALLKTVSESINIEPLLKLAKPITSRLIKNRSPVRNSKSQIKVAIAKDRAFCFYYEDNLDLLRQAGSQIVPFSPLSDTKIPDNVDAIYIGGGYPELYANALSRNESMLKAIHKWALSGKPLYAECGGLMYLSKGIHDFDGNFFKMAGVFPFETQIPPYPPLVKGGKGGLRPHLGYREVILKEDCILGKKGEKVRGHEFHYSEIDNRTRNLLTEQAGTECRAQNPVCHSVLDTESRESMDSRLKTAGMTEHGIQAKIYSVKNGSGQNLHDEGYRFKNTLASYVHVHFGSNPDIANNFIKFSMET